MDIHFDVELLRRDFQVLDQEVQKVEQQSAACVQAVVAVGREALEFNARAHAAVTAHQQVLVAERVPMLLLLVPLLDLPI